MLRVGFARLDVTPPLGVSLAGYFQDRKADGILDPIELNAVAVANGEETLLLIAADLISMDAANAKTVRELIAAETGVPAHCIAINCLHQHTTLRVGAGLFGVRTGAYFEVLRRKLADVARLAVGDLREARMGVAQKQTAETISFIRRYRMKDGTVATNPFSRVSEIDHPVGEADNTVRLIRFSRKEGGDVALVSFATHPDVIGGTKLSADWPGFVRRFTEKELAGVHCALFNGAQGDTNHLNPYDLQTCRADRYAFSAHMGRVITDAVCALWENTTPCTSERLSGAVAEVAVKTRTDGEERYDEMAAFYKAYEEGTLDYKPGITELGEARRIIGIRTAPIYNYVTLTVLGIGEVLFVGFGGEPFTKYADNVRAACPDRFVLTSCNTNGSEGYLVTTKAFEEGGYEASSTSFTPGLEESCCEAAVKLLKN